MLRHASPIRGASSHMNSDASCVNPEQRFSPRFDSGESGPKGEASEVNTGRVLERRLPSLDGLRAISICFVLIGHLGGGLYFHNKGFIGSTLTALPDFGVKIFFVISGYLITLLLMSELVRTGEINIFHFYVRRAFRILPAAYTFIAVSILFLGNTLTLTNQALAVAFAENYAPNPEWNFGHL